MPTSSTKPRLVLAVPHELLLEALEGLLDGSGFTVVARCTGVAEIERCVRAHAPDLAVVDSDLVAAGGLADALQGTRDALSGGHLVVLAPGLDATLARETLALEVDGVLLKSTTRDDFAANLRRLAAGDAVYPAGWLAAARRLPGEGEGEAALSDRQREVLELLAQGLPNEIIAERLFISKNTVKFHVAAIYQRLGVRNRVQAARALNHLGNPEAEAEVLPHPSGWGGRPPRAVGTARPTYTQNHPPARGRTTRRAVSPPPSRP